MSQKITLRDVATYAGVSVTTVSNVVRGWPYITTETRQKVQQAILELGYSPHPIAQGLRSGRTQTIGFVVPDLANPHFASLVSTVEDVAYEHGYSVLVFNTHENERREAEGVRRLTNGWGDGIVVVQTRNALQTGNLLQSVTIPVVAIDRVLNSYTGAFCNVDNLELTRLAMQHLYDLGHRRIAHLAGPHYALSAQARMDGYQCFVHEAGLEYMEYRPGNRELCSEDEGYYDMRHLLDEHERPTAVIDSNDRMAIGAIHAIQEYTLSVPNDISVVGADDIEVSKYINPPLTTVRQPLEEMARIGVELLLQLIQNANHDRMHISLKPTLIVRASTAPPKQR